MRALESIGRVISEQAAISSTGSRTDSEAFLRLISHPDALRVLAAGDPLAGARVRGLAAKQQLLAAEGGTLIAAQIAAILGVIRQVVDKRRKLGKRLAFDTGRHGYAYARSGR